MPPPPIDFVKGGGDNFKGEGGCEVPSLQIILGS